MLTCKRKGNKINIQCDLFREQNLSERSIALIFRKTPQEVCAKANAVMDAETPCKEI